MENNKTKRIVIAGVVAAIYTVLTMVLAPLSFGPIQLRLSELLVLLVFVDPIYIIGLTLGCMLSNLLGGYGILDIVFGSLATLLAGIATYKTKEIISNNKVALLVGSIWPSIINGVIIGWMLNVTTNAPLFATMLSVGFCEFLVVTVIGVPLYLMLSKTYVNFTVKSI